MNDEFSRVLSQQMEYYSNDPNADRINRLKGEMSQVRFRFSLIDFSFSMFGFTGGVCYSFKIIFSFRRSESLNLIRSDKLKIYTNIYFKLILIKSRTPDIHLHEQVDYTNT